MKTLMLILSLILLVPVAQAEVQINQAQVMATVSSDYQQLPSFNHYKKFHIFKEMGEAQLVVAPQGATFEYVLTSGLLKGIGYSIADFQQLITQNKSNDKELVKIFFTTRQKTNGRQMDVVAVEIKRESL